MESLLWNAAIWGAAYHVTKEPGARKAENRLRLALALSLVATAAIVTGSAEEIVRDPVIVERALRGSLSGLAGLLALPVIARRANVLLTRPLPTFTWFAAYGLVVALSVLYSVAPLVTAGKAFEFGMGLLIVVGMLTSDRPRDNIQRAIEMIVIAFGIGVAVALLGFFSLPGLFTTPDSRPGFLLARTLGSPYAGSNGLSFNSAMLSVYCMAVILGGREGRGRRLALAGLVVGLAGVAISSGRQGLVILVVSAIVLLAWHSPVRLALLAIPAGALVVASADVLIQAFSRGQSTGLLFSLSGRTYWWASAVEAWLEQPLMGFGYGAGGRFVALQRVGAGGVSSVHSGYLEVLMGVGLLGFIPFAIAVVRVSVGSMRLLGGRLELAILIVPLVLHTFISLGFGGWWSSDLALLALLTGLVDVRDSGSSSQATGSTEEVAPAFRRTGPR